MPLVGLSFWRQSHLEVNTMIKYEIDTKLDLNRVFVCVNPPYVTVVHVFPYQSSKEC